MKNKSTYIDIYDAPEPSILIDGCETLGISLSTKQTEQFVRYYEMLSEKNKVMNLTTVIQWDEVQTKHYLDSLLLSSAIDLRKNSLKDSGSEQCKAITGKRFSLNELQVLDMGTGAGFPGIPLKIIFPDLNMVLADSLNKRILFLDDVIRELELDGIKTVHGRAEDLGKMDTYREAFDLVVSRAVANLSSLSEYCLPFVKTGGLFVSYKSAGINEELTEAEKAIHILGGGKAEVTTLPLPCTNVERSFVIIRKENHTPEKYPRKAGIPSRDPL